MDDDETSIRPRENPYEVGHLPVSGEYGGRHNAAAHGERQDADAREQDDEIDYYFE